MNIDVNTASRDQLMALRGIAEELADAVIRGRPFASIDDVISIPGIGERTLERLKAQGLVIGGGSQEGVPDRIEAEINEMDRTFVIAGRIHRSDGSGVHGLVVDIHDRDLTFYETLGTVRTNRVGVFQFEYRPEGFEVLFDAEPEILLTIRDAGGTKLHTVEEGTRFRHGDTASFDIELRDEVLVDHLEKTRGLSPEGGSLVPRRHLQTVDEAWTRLARSRGDQRDFDKNWAICPWAPIMRFDDLVDVAVGVMEGRPEDVERFHDMLTTMEAGSAPAPGRAARLASFSDEQLADTGYWKAVQNALTRAEGAAPTPGESIVPHDEFVAVAAAAFLIAGGELRAAHRNLGTVLSQICDVLPFGPVVRAAESVRVNQPEALRFFDRAWTDYIDMCGHDDGPPSPFPKPEPGPSPEPRPCPDPWPPPNPDDLPVNPWLIEKWLCALDVAIALTRRRDPKWYTISSISNSRACPGATITIRGYGFGTWPGQVRFQTTSGDVAVNPNYWSNVRVTVVVPDDATCGQLSLVVGPSTEEVCSRVIDMYKLDKALSTYFFGGRTRVSALNLYGASTPGCAVPGDVIGVSWATCNADSVSVQVRDAGGAVLASDNSAASTGNLPITLPSYSSTTLVTATVTAAGPCGSEVQNQTITVQRPFNLTINGIEVTQAIQYYQAAQHLTDPADRGANNSLQLVANKAAWVRVYLRSGQTPSFDGGQLANVTGTLSVERRVGGAWSVIANLPPNNAPVTAQDSFPNHDSERSNINASLNFVVPANQMTGLLRFTINVSSPDACVGGEDSDSVQVDVNLRQQLRIAAVAIGYNGPPLGGGPNVNFVAPTGPQITNDAAFALTVYPVQNNPNRRTIATVNATQPLSDAAFPAGGCDPNWTPILNQVANARTNDGNQAGWIYYGFVTANIPIAHGNVGCATGGNGAGLLGGGGTFAHEVGHQVGLNHAPCGAVGTVTPGFPLYEPYDTGVTFVNAAGNTVWQDASIGEYGLNINNGLIFNPNPARANNGKDLMSYCANAWISIFTHNFMVNNAGLNPVALATGMGSRAGEGFTSPQQKGDSMTPLITMLGSFAPDGSVDVSSVARVPSREPTMSGHRTAYRVELIDADGNVASSAPVFTIPAHHGNGDCGSGSSPEKAAEPPFAFIASMPDVTEGSAIRITKDDTVIWERKRPAVKPVLGNVGVSVRRGRLRVSWSFEVAPEVDPEVWLRWSEDGEHWNGLAVGLTGDSVEIDATDIPADRVVIEAVAHDGYHSVGARSRFVRLPSKPVVLATVHPADQDRFPAGALLHLGGMIITGKTEQEPTWLINGKEVGTGLDTWVPSPAPGTHEVELRCPGAEPVKVRIVIEG